MTEPGPIAPVGSGEFLPVMETVDAGLLAGRPSRAVFLPTILAAWRNGAALAGCSAGACALTALVTTGAGWRVEGRRQVWTVAADGRRTPYPAGSTVPLPVILCK
jgi:hypothetical protein